MTRARNIKPGFFTNGDLLECTPLARLLFAGLWCEADRRGILEDRPKTLKVKLLPGDDCDVAALLRELESRGFILRYEAADVRCILIPNFDKHQNPHVKEQASTLPAPNEPGASPVQTPVKHRTSPADSLIPDSGSPIPDPPTTPPSGEATPTGFAEFWMSYPNRKQRQTAVKAWLRLNPDAALRARILAALAEQKTWREWAKDGGRYVPHPATWLNAGSWDDEAAPITLPDPATWSGKGKLVAQMTEREKAELRLIEAAANEATARLRRTGD